MRGVSGKVSESERKKKKKKEKSGKLVESSMKEKN